VHREITFRDRCPHGVAVFDVVAADLLELDIENPNTQTPGMVPVSFNLAANIIVEAQKVSSLRFSNATFYRPQCSKIQP
jgi:hypothetical protein